MASSKSTMPLSEAPELTYDHSPSNIASLCEHLKSVRPALDSSSSAHIRTTRSSTSHSPALSDAHVPSVVFFPESTADVSAIVEACHERKIAITSFAGGTSLGGALAATRAGGVCIDFIKMNRVIETNEKDLDVVVQPGVGWVELNGVLEKKGLFFPVDPAPGAKIGGMIAMSCSGTNAYRYGTMKDWVVSLTLVLADGSVVKTRNRPRKSSAGYDLNHLVIGSEGTLALVTEAVLRVTALPQNLHVGMVTFPSLQSGVDVAVKVLRSGHLLEAIELVDAESMRAIKESGLADGKGPIAVIPTLFVKFAGSKQSVDDQIEFFKQLCSQHNALQVEISAEKHRIESIWGVRKSLAHALVRMKKEPSDVFMHTDAAVPISKVAELISRSEELVRCSSQARDWFCGSVAHIGDGNVHTAIVCPKDAKEEVERLLGEVQKLALELDGTITGEHGVGLKLRDLLADEVGDAGVDMMRKIKLALDPRGILNPDKVVRLQGDI